MSEGLIEAVGEEVEAFNTADWDRLAAVVTEDTVHEEPGTGRRVQGRDAFVKFVRAWKAAFPDAQGTVTDAFACGDRVTARMSLGGHPVRCARATGERRDRAHQPADDDARLPGVPDGGREDCGVGPLLRHARHPGAARHDQGRGTGSRRPLKKKPTDHWVRKSRPYAARPRDGEDQLDEGDHRGRTWPRR